MGAKPETKYKRFPKVHRNEAADHVNSAGKHFGEIIRKLGLAGRERGRRLGHA